MIDREKVIKGLECCLPPHDPNCDLCPYDSIDLRCRAKLRDDVMTQLKDSGQNKGWLCEKRTNGYQITDLLCVCGSKVYFTTLLFNDGFTANELYCPNCGLSMRSPHHDINGVWLRKHWEEVVLKAQEPEEPVVDIDTWKCGNCGHTLEHQELLGDNVLFHEQYNYCPECGRAVKWK